MRPLFVWALIGILGWAFTQTATLSRADLAVRLIEMETCWERYRGSESARLRATQPLSDGITAFFGNRLDVLARYLTITCARLESEAEPSPEQLYAGSVGVRLPAVVDATTPAEPITPELFRYYEAEPKPLTLVWSLIPRESTQALASGSLALPTEQPPSLNLPSSEGDYWVHWRILAGQQELRQWKVPVSVVNRLQMRLESLRKAIEAYPDADGMERATVAMTIEVLEQASKGTRPETYYPLLQLLRQAEAMVERWAQHQRGWQPQPGDYWMCAPYQNSRVYFRLYVPKGFKPDAPLPLVVALHGAGGNEHLFFDGYGLGQVLREAEKRGWAVVAPRSGTGLNHVWGAMEAVQKLLPIDKERVYLMGHSMGGAQTFASAGQRPELFRAIAVIAGAGQPANLPKDLPVFLAVGEQELPFLLNNVERAHQQLKGAELSQLEYKRYNGCEHLMIVREALPDAFAFFEQAPPREGTP